MPTPVGGTVDVLTVDLITINPSDALTAALNVTADIPGSAANGIAVGVPASMVDTYTWVESAVVSVIIAGGGDIETDASFYARVALAFQSLSATYVIDNQFAAAALSVAGVGRAKGFGLWDGAGTVGTMPGHVTVAVAGPDGANVSSGIKATVLSLLTAGAVAGLQVHVIDFIHVTENLALTYVLAPGYVGTAVTAQIDTLVRAWINPATWPYTETLTSINQIILRIGALPGVDNVTALTGLTTVTGGVTLPTVGTFVITQT